jgi:hypothetical protein
MIFFLNIHEVGQAGRLTFQDAMSRGSGAPERAVAKVWLTSCTDHEPCVAQGGFTGGCTR